MDLIRYAEPEISSEGLKALMVTYVLGDNNCTINANLSDHTLKALIHLLKITKAKSSSNDIRVLHSDDSFPIIIAVGVKEDDIFNIKKAGALAFKRAESLNVGTLFISNEFKLCLLAEGALLASYTYDFLKNKSEKPRIKSEEQNEDFEKVKIIIEAQNFSRFLSDTPANLMTPILFTEYTKLYLKDLENLEINVYDRTFAEQKKMGLFLSVTNGSNQECRFVHIKYRGRKCDKIDITLIGKGITFDSGGISLKPAANMEDMKLDMSGAASVVATIGLAARLSKKINLDVIAPLCENLPFENATKPGDVAIAMNGKSVEIINTDAEGRLILADALLFAQESEPELILDVATLTGAIGIALGPVYCGYFSNDEQLSSFIAEASSKSGDLMWRMPLNENYKSQLKSSVADLQNVGTIYGGACVAAAFLQEFIGKNTKWAHVDIASCMINSVFFEMYGKGSPGIPVKMFYSLIEIIEERKN